MRAAEKVTDFMGRVYILNIANKLSPFYRRYSGRILQINYQKSRYIATGTVTASSLLIRRELS
jgi:hypothetical protein